MTPLEIAANVVTTLSIWLAARNSRHTWSTGIVGCVLFAVQFFRVQLYADVTLQVFFLATSGMGWWQWRHADHTATVTERPVTRASPRALAVMGAAALVVTAVYGFLLHRFTDAYMPYVDAAVLALSVVAQCLLMRRQVETWPGWLAVNTLSVPLYASRGLWLTAALYAAYWVNAWYGWARWRKALRAADADAGTARDGAAAA
jgi:nicotinamide mononucleotide transporter